MSSKTEERKVDALKVALRAISKELDEIGKEVDEIGDRLEISTPEKITLWQSIEKKHMEYNTGERISDEDWEQFVEKCQDGFADEVSTIAMEWWNDHSKTEHGD